MTILFYKVGKCFTKSYFEALKISLDTGNPMEKCFVEYPVKDLDEALKIGIAELVDKYYRKEVKFL